MVIRQTSTRQHTHGFTLLELLIVLVIFTLLVALIPPMFSGAVPGARLKGAARDLAIALRYARSQAITRNKEMAVQLNLKTSEYTIGKDRTQTMPKGIEMKVAQAAGSSSADETRRLVYFYPDGSSSGTRITLSGETRAYHLYIDWLTGRTDISEAQDAAR